MDDSAFPTKQHHGQSNFHKSMTREIQTEIVRIIEECAGHLDHFCRNSEVISDTIFEAQEVAEYLLVEMRAYPGYLVDHRVHRSQLERGNLAAELASYRDALAVTDRLAQCDPGTSDWQHDLAMAYQHVGDVQLKQCDPAGALSSYRDALAIADRLARLDPKNADRQCGLAVSYIKVGKVQLAQGDLAGALASYRDGLAVGRRLASMAVAPNGKTTSYFAAKRQV